MKQITFKVTGVRTLDSYVDPTTKKETKRYSYTGICPEDLTIFSVTHNLKEGQTVAKANDIIVATLGNGTTMKGEAFTAWHYRMHHSDSLLDDAISMDWNHQLMMKKTRQLLELKRELAAASLDMSAFTG